MKTGFPKFRRYFFSGTLFRWTSSLSQAGNRESPALPTAGCIPSVLSIALFSGKQSMPRGHFTLLQRSSTENEWVGRHAVFISSESEDYSLIVDGKAIGVHAVCRSPEIYIRPCVYCQLSDPRYDDVGRIEYSPGCEIEEESMECEESVSEDDFIEEVLFSPHDDSQCTLYYTSC